MIYIRCHSVAFLEDATEPRGFLQKMQDVYGNKSEEYKKIEWAEMLTRELFSGEKRLTGEPYITHPNSVAMIATKLGGVRDYRVIIGCIIHDNREYEQEQGIRSMWSPKFVETWFGEYIEWLLASQTMPQVLGEMTKERAHSTFYNSMRALCKRRDFFEIKLADRLHNLWTLSSEIMPARKIISKIEETREGLLPYAQRHSILVRELHEVLEWLEENNNNK
ncbi:MAG TPA: HD domain-containing protein [Candidatus Kaiserbacteria bacterium]|nr:HD domain-containing protein [Candidatus Kaiserbacteria bacterium]